MTGDLRTMTGREFSEAVARGAWVILPAGTTEEHGPHLPLGADMIQAEHVAMAVARALDGVVAPGLAYGLCRTTRNFPGTVSIGYATLKAFARKVLAGYVEQGARKIAVLSGHAGSAHLEALREAALSLVEGDEGLTVLVVGPGDLPLPVMGAAGMPADDGHAASLETSVMLAIDGHLVHTDRIPAATHPAFPRGQVLAYPERFFPSGVMGDPSGISPVLGERAVNHIVGEIVRLLRAVSAGGGG